MEAKVSKAQLEVWESKERLFQQVKNLTGVEAIKFIISQTAETIKSLNLKEKKSSEVAK